MGQLYKDDNSQKKKSDTGKVAPPPPLALVVRQRYCHPLCEFWKSFVCTESVKECL